MHTQGKPTVSSYRVGDIGGGGDAPGIEEEKPEHGSATFPLAVSSLPPWLYFPPQFLLKYLYQT